MRIVRIFLANAMLLAASGCSTGSLFKESPSLPPLEAGKGRVVIYRTFYIAPTHVPEVLLNGVSLGKPLQRGLFYRDVAPGSYAVKTSLTQDIVNFHVAAGERKYIRLNTSYSFRVTPELVDGPKGEADTAGLGVIPAGLK